MGRNHILVVDDEQSIRELLVDVLTEEGYDVECASDGREALDAIVRTSPRLMLLDLHMPLMDGRGLIASLRARGIAVPIVLVSAGMDIATHAADVGVVGFIAKPFEVASLLTTVKRHYRAA